MARMKAETTHAPDFGFGVITYLRLRAAGSIGEAHDECQRGI
jgi:hypothetical protein